MPLRIYSTLVDASSSSVIYGCDYVSIHAVLEGRSDKAHLLFNVIFFLKCPDDSPRECFMGDS